MQYKYKPFKVYLFAGIDSFENKIPQNNKISTQFAENRADFFLLLLLFNAILNTQLFVIGKLLTNKSISSSFKIKF